MRQVNAEMTCMDACGRLRRSSHRRKSTDLPGITPRASAKTPDTIADTFYPMLVSRRSLPTRVRGNERVPTTRRTITDADPMDRHRRPGRDRALRHRRVQSPDAATQYGARGMERDRRAVAPPHRPDPEPGRDREGLRRPRARGVR